MKLFASLIFTAANAFAQVPSVGQQIGQPMGPAIGQPSVQAPVPAAAPAPAPVVGQNVDTSQIPQAMTPEEMSKRLGENAASRPARGYRPTTSQSAPPPSQFSPPVEASQLKSEIVPVLPPAQRPAELRAVLRTSVGDITIRLDRVNAPRTVDYFAGLAKGDVDFTDIKTSKPVKRPFYNGLIFHRVVKGTLIQTGDPFGNGRGNSGQTIPDEIKATMKFDRPGLVAMAPMRDSTGTKISKGTNSSQFFITLREMPEWNGQFAIFGEVEDGLDVVQKIANAKVGPTERPIKRIYLVAVDIVESAK